MNIILIGYRGSGKTSVGRELARILERPFFDSDRMIFAKTGRSIGEIVEISGWQAFREMEKAVIADLSGLDGVVIALGGGAVMDADNVAMFGKKGRFVWLQADTKVLALRMSGDQNGAAQRPALTAAGTLAEIDEVLSKRLPFYRDIADAIIDTTGKEPAGIAAEIIALLEKKRVGEQKRPKRRQIHVR